MALSTTLSNHVVSVGDTVRIALKIREGEKERIQQFEGVIVAIKGSHGERTVTIRRIAAGGIGVERIIPVDLPSIVSVSVKRSANVRRAKLYYLRQREGKERLLLKERAKTRAARIDEPVGTPSRGRRPRVPQKTEAVAAS